MGLRDIFEVQRSALAIQGSNKIMAKMIIQALIDQSKYWLEPTDISDIITNICKN